MGQKFQYDESGGTFFYFLLSFLALVLIPATIYYWPRKKRRDPEDEQKQCQCSGCREKRRRQQQSQPWEGPKNLFTKLLIVAGWLFLAFIAYKVSQFDYELSSFDPYEILGVPLGSSQQEIRRAYRKLSLVLHPDKDTGDEKEFMKLSKAYKALTDDEARKNWEKYGNPDGPGAMSFGIALPSWIVEKENSIWVLGLYALVFMVALPIAVGTWWNRKIRYTGDQVLVETTNMYYYFFHRTPDMVLKRAIMILGGSFEFDKRNNSEVIERPSDNVEVTALIKQLPNLNENNKEELLSYPYSIKARAIIHAHLARYPLNPETLDVDRRMIVGKCPYLIQEQINCVNQLILLAYAGKIKNLLKIGTLENCMKLSPMIIQAMKEHSSPFLQLPHINEDNLKYFMVKKRQVKTLLQYAQMSEEDRRALLRSLSEEEYEDVMKVLGGLPVVDFQVKCEVMDDENPTEVTAGAIVTVSVDLTRSSMSEYFGGASSPSEATNIVDLEDKEETQTVVSKRPVWMKQKKGGGGGNKNNKKRPSAKKSNNRQQQNGDVVQQKSSNEDAQAASESEDTDSDQEVEKNAEQQQNSSEEETNGGKSGNAAAADDDDDDNEWERLRAHHRDRTMEGRSKRSHRVHCPWYPHDKHEYWWTYICDRKSGTLLTAPYHVTNLVDHQVVELKFTAPNWIGVYNFTVCLRSDSYVGFDQQKNIRLDVKEAPAKIVSHPQWEFEDDEDVQEEREEESDYTTDEDIPDDDDDDDQ